MTPTVEKGGVDDEDKHEGEVGVGREGRAGLRLKFQRSCMKIKLGCHILFM